ncbi:MAG TPA: VOC family protein [Acidiferrobacteraceae bacterium]|nr:VOC family protein [Acidiferrobacteraceae bacterium]
MIDHISTYTTDYVKTKNFYEKAFSALGYSLQTEFVAEWNKEFPTRRICAFGLDRKPIFWVIETKEKYTPRHVAFTAKTRADVDAFYNQAIENGGVDNGKPGLRPIYHENYYGAFAIDPDGNNVEAVCHTPE